MPIFEYRCGSCGGRFSVLLGMVAQAANPSCPDCGSDDLRKLVSRFSTVRSEEDFVTDDGDVSPDSLMRELKEELGGNAGDELEAAFESAEGMDSVPE